MRYSDFSGEDKIAASLKKIRLMRRLLFPAVLFVIIVILTRLPTLTTGSQNSEKYRYLKSDLPQAEQQSFDVRYYRLKMNFRFRADTTAGNIEAETDIRLASKVRKLREVLLDFNSSMQVDSVAGLAFRFKREGPNLRIFLRHQLGKEKWGTIRIFYHGWPAPYHPWIAGLGIAWRPEGDRSFPWISTMNPPFGASTWFPCKDNPADKADSVRFEISVPQDLTVVCNGLLLRETSTPNRRRQFVFVEKYPIATYLMAVNIGKFIRYEFPYQGARRKFPLRFFVFPEDTQYVENVRQQMSSMLDFYEATFGPYPFDREKYGMVKSSPRGGMENQTITAIDQFSPDRWRLYAHELAHQWAGDEVTNATFHQSFLNEGLATYMTALYIEHSRGEKQFRKYLGSLRPEKAGPVEVRKILIPDSVYDTQRVYYKGAWFFHMLRSMLGDSAFFAALRQYFSGNGYGIANSDSLRKTFEKNSAISLKDFFSSWLKNGSPPKVTAKLQPMRGEKHPFRYKVFLSQEQKGSPYYYFLPIRFTFRNLAGQDTVIRVKFFAKSQKFDVAFPAKVDTFQVDPGKNWLLGRQ